MILIYIQLTKYTSNDELLKIKLATRMLQSNCILKLDTRASVLGTQFQLVIVCDSTRQLTILFDTSPESWAYGAVYSVRFYVLCSE